jgi:flagellar biosynthesis protein FlhB
MSDQGQKTEKPTPQRLRKARQEGQFPVSREFPAALQFLGFAALFATFTAHFARGVAVETHRILVTAFAGGEVGDSLPRAVVGAGYRVILPLLGAGLVLALLMLAGHLAVTGLGISGKKLAPDISRLNPMQKIRQMPRQNGFHFIQACILLPVFCWCLYLVLQDNFLVMMRLPFMGVRQGVQLFTDGISGLFWKAAGLFLVFGAVDFMREKQHYLKQMRMSHQEIREEFKETEGNPETKMRIRRIRRDLLRRRMMAEVPNASAVIVNPTHYAVAIRYQLDSMVAPKVVAKGKNYLALRIRALATEHEVPIIENPPLAQALYKSVDVGQEIPPHLYRAVAEILAYIYRILGGRLPGAA